MNLSHVPSHVPPRNGFPLTTRPPGPLRVASRQNALPGMTGDFFALVRHGDATQTLLLADVAGNGVAAARLAAEVRPHVMRCLRENQSPAHVLGALNERLEAELPLECFVAALAVRIDVAGSALRAASAGHLGPFLRPLQGRSRALSTPAGWPLGLFPNARYQEVEHELSTGDVVVLASDGITDRFATTADPLGAAGFLARLDRVTGDRDALCTALLSGIRGAADATAVAAYAAPATRDNQPANHVWLDAG